MRTRDEIDPRVERSREHVLAATVDLLREVGYGPLTIEAVAARSGVAKSTVYRHWGGKARLVADAFSYARRETQDVPPPGPVRDRVVALLQDLAAGVVAAGPRLECLLPALIDAAERSEETAVLSCRMAEESVCPLVGVLDDAVAAGELPADTDAGVLADALVGPILLRRLFHRPEIRVDQVPALVDQVLPAAGRPVTGGNSAPPRRP